MARKPTASHLTSHIGFWMRKVSNHVSYNFAKKLAESGVTVAEWVVLREMFSTDETTSPGAVAELTGLTKGAISKLIARLLDKNLVSRKESPRDARSQDIALTPKGAALVPKLSKLADENDSDFFKVISKSDRDVLIGILKRLADEHGLRKAPVE